MNYVIPNAARLQFEEHIDNIYSKAESHTNINKVIITNIG